MPKKLPAKAPPAKRVRVTSDLRFEEEDESWEDEGQEESQEEDEEIPTAGRKMPPPPPKAAHRELEKPFSPMQRSGKIPPAPKKSPPLFIKLDKYRDLVKDVAMLKSYALGLRDALDALADLQREMHEGVTVANKALDTFTAVISTLDSKLLKSDEMAEAEVEIPPEMDRYIKNVHDQIDKIRRDLKSITS
ncbi:MAG: hypothetical protein HY367_04175 [Candidatus Aenigmarchaeota archaeon]|nr:hypothetical protein [Candidatus Aenigmarchaeota archaeon]